MGKINWFDFFFPLFYFWLKGYFNKNEKKLILLITFLGFFQAFMGWYMVESGLIDKPDVSHFRLSAHLITAFFIYSTTIVLFLEYSFRKKKLFIISVKKNQTS